MRVIVSGGRHYRDVARLWRVLDWLDGPDGAIRLVIDGASDDVTGPYVGADYWAHQWALARNKPTSRFHADWTGQGRAAGPIRNGRMLHEGEPDALVHFPGGDGTANMVRQAKALGLRTIDGGPKSEGGSTSRRTTPESNVPPASGGREP